MIIKTKHGGTWILYDDVSGLRYYRFDIDKEAKSYDDLGCIDPNRLHSDDPQIDKIIKAFLRVEYASNAPDTQTIQHISNDHKGYGAYLTWDDIAVITNGETYILNDDGKTIETLI